MDNKNFWTTLPGILTAVASLITAIAGLIAVFNRTPAVKPSVTMTAPALAATQNMPAVQMALPPAATLAQPTKPIGCDKAIGNWNWFLGGVVTFEKDGHLAWRKDAGDLLPMALGTWSCIDPKTDEMTLLWQPTGIVDTVNIAPDGKFISGTNYTGIRVTGTKR